MSKRTVIQAWVVGASLLGCSTTYILGCANTTTRTDDAFEPSPDVFVIQDAGVDASVEDAPNLDAFALDAFTPRADAFSPDAFIVPTEVCNGTDDDLDTTVDETAELGCRTAAHAEAATCESGRCQCRPAGTPLTPGLYADCNADFADGCEVPLGTDANCGACGDACDPASQCRFREGAGFACGPADIRDFTLARDDGVIACILRAYAETGEARVVCRGPNTAHALSDTEPETAMLGWTFVDLPVDPFNVSLRASRQTRPDGRDAMTVCVGGYAGIYCRGDDSTGLLVQPGESARGIYQVVLGDEYFYLREWSVWNGQGVARGIDLDGFEAAILVWGGAEAPDTTRRISLGGENGYFTTGDQVLFYRQEDPNGLFSWGPQRGFLGGTGWVDAPGEALPLVRVRDVAYPSCARDVCCAIREGRVACWGHQPSAPNEFTILPDLPPVSYGVRVVPHRDGHVFACFLHIEGSVYTLHCADATAAIEGNPVSFSTIVPYPDYRNDWQAVCAPRRSDWWQCWGTHDGWGHE